MEYCKLCIAFFVIFWSTSCNDRRTKESNLSAITVFNRDSLQKIAKDNLSAYDSLRKTGQYDTAIQVLDKTIALKTLLLNDSALKPFYISAVLYKAYLLRVKEKYTEAENLFLHLIEIQGEKWKNELNHADAFGNLGNIYTRYGDYKKALGYLTSENEIFKQAKDTEYYVRSVNNIAIAQQELNNYKASLELLQGSEKWNTPVTESKVILYTCSANAALHLHDVLMMNGYIEKAEAQLKYFEAEDDKALYKALIEGIKADYLLSTQQFKKAAEIFRHVIGVNISLDSSFVRSRDAGKLYNQLGKAYIGSSQFDSALYYFNKGLNAVIKIDTADIFSLPAVSQLYPENTILESLDDKAEALRRLYEKKADTRYLQTAINCFDLSFKVERKLMQYFSYDESKLLMLNESRQRSQKAISVCYKLYQLTKNNAWSEKAYQFAEKNKAFVLLESVKRNLATNTLLQKDTLYQKAQALQLQLSYNERSIGESNTDSARRKLLEQKTKMENDLLFANTALSRQSNAYKSVMEKEDSISANLVSSGLLNDHTGLVEFFSADSATYAFVLSKDQPLQFRQYNTRLSSNIDTVLSFFKTPTAISNDPLGYQHAAYALYIELGLDKLNKAWQNLVIIPDGKLSFVPFDALTTSSSDGTSLKQAPWLINRCNTIYGYSAHILLTQKNNNLANSGNIAVFAPIFANNENSQKPLLFSGQEAEAVAQNKNDRLFLREKASLSNFKSQFEQPGIIHVATHAYADTGTSNDPKIEFIDSSLLLNELYAMHTEASLVVLSACETGIGRINSSEGPMSLARGFYYAGAKNVITSYWSVDDKSTAALFKDFYKMLPGSNSSAALCEAKRSFIKNTTASYASPYYWAGFVHFGMPQEKGEWGYWWWLLTIPVVVIVIYGVKRKVKL